MKANNLTTQTLIFQFIIKFIEIKKYPTLKINNDQDNLKIKK